ncbi:NAD(P)H-dependent oxidoreductase [bacterium]|nr:NAD(P)H-dependent oxidoreductase [bacterium]
MNVLAICGSLRAESSNLEMLRAAQALAPSTIEVVFADGMGDLPPFNPDLDAEGALPPEGVAQWRAQVADADGVIISSPEYAHGVPGALKNALDWLVSTPALFEKPVLLVNAAAAGATFAQRSLAETLRTMNANVLDASLLEPFVKMRVTRLALDQEASAILRASMAALAAAIEPR